VRRIIIILCILSAACSKKSKPAESAPADPAAFFKSQGSFCTVEKAGKALDSIGQLEEIFVFGRDNVLRLMSYDLDSQRRLQFNGKGQARVKETEKAAFQVNGDRLVLKVEGARRAREAQFKRVSRGTAACFEMMPGKNSTVHCPCALPENN